MTERSLVYMPLDAIQPAARNSKKHDLDGLAESFDRFGFTAPVEIDERTGRLVSGHGRVAGLQAKKALGHAPPDGVLVENGAWLLPVVRGWSSVDDAEAEAYLIGANALVEAGGWDDAVLADMLVDLRGTSAGLSGVGFDDAALDELLASLGRDVPVAEHTRHIGDPDDVPDMPNGDPITEPGDLWLLGPHRVLCGDSFDSEDVGRVMDGRRANIVLTDPPFAIYGSSSGVSSEVADDSMVRPFFEQLGRTIHAHVLDFSHVYVHCDWRSFATLWDGMKRARLSPKNCLVWDKGHSGMGSNWPNAHEFVAYFAKLPQQTTMTSSAKTGQRVVNDQGNILRFDRPRGEERLHNAAKPVAMLCLILEKGSDLGDLVLDLFGGSGSTLMAADRSGRVCAVMEQEARLVDVICARYQSLTGEKPVLESTGEPYDFLATV